jgi:uncharacterized membrane protein
LVRLALFVAYAVFAHLSVLGDSAALELASLTSLSAGLLYPRLRQGRLGAWLALGGIAAALALLSVSAGGRYILYLPSVVLPSLALFGFVRSLLPGHTAIVSEIAAVAHGPLPPVLVRYTRGVTWLWTLVIGVVLALDLYLIFAAPRQAWSEFANFYIYLSLAAVFLLEYLYRRWRFRHMRQPGFVDYLRLLAQQRPGLA